MNFGGPANRSERFNCLLFADITISHAVHICARSGVCFSVLFCSQSSLKLSKVGSLFQICQRSVDVCWFRTSGLGFVHAFPLRGAVRMHCDLAVSWIPNPLTGLSSLLQRALLTSKCPSQQSTCLFSWCGGSALPPAHSRSASDFFCQQDAKVASGTNFATLAECVVDFDNEKGASRRPVCISHRSMMWPVQARAAADCRIEPACRAGDWLGELFVPPAAALPDQEARVRLAVFVDCRLLVPRARQCEDRKSTRLNSSHT